MSDPFLYPPGHQRTGQHRSIPVQQGEHRLGVPADKLGIYWFPIMTEEKRQAVTCVIIPPEALRDAPREVIREFFLQRQTGIAEQLAEEVYKSYTSDPADAAGAQNIADILAAHAKALRKG